MWVSHAELTHFRNYTKLVLDLENTVYFIVGPNGQGKTNILEAVAYASLSKSFRNNNVRDIIQRDNDFLRLNFLVNKTNEQIGLEEFVGKSGANSLEHAFWKNKVSVSLDGYLAALKVVVFSPENVNLLLLGPDMRRKYLNFLQLQNFPQKWRLISDYGKVLAQRNALLWQVRKGYAETKELEYWNNKLISEGAKIIETREEIVKRLNEYFGKIFEEISESTEKAEVIYRANVRGSDFSTKLLEFEQSDIEKGITQVGPHRDNLEIHVGGRDILSFGSRGELRTALLALKFAECKMLPDDERPVLLLDDVFSELDAKRREKVLELSRPYQTFITTCEIADLPEKRENTKTIFVKNGKLEYE